MAFLASLDLDLRPFFVQLRFSVYGKMTFPKYFSPSSNEVLTKPVPSPSGVQRRFKQRGAPAPSLRVDGLMDEL